MTKQEFMAMSLPYGLKCEVLDHLCDYVGNKYDLLIGILQWSKDGNLWCVQTLGGARPSFERVKPILRPLSDLTKPIEHKGEKFVPIDLLSKTSGIYITNLGNVVYLDELCAKSFLKLIEWHFDIAGLIEKGEAIDVNTLEINPYK